MTSELVLWIIGGGIVLGLMALFVTIMARGMDGRSASTATAHPGGRAIKALLGAATAAKLHEAQTHAQTHAKISSEADKKGGRAGVVAAFVAALAIASGVAAIVANKAGRPGVALVPVGVSAGNLQGTLLSPKRNAPVVLIVPGSGPTDRDGNSPMGVKADMYRLLAEGLADRGIASVRVDKRGMFGSAAAGDPNAVTVGAYAEDYRQWIDAIRAMRNVKCVWLLGHSEGALMVSAAAEGRRDVCGLILVSGMGRKMGDVIREQLKANPANAPLLDQALAAIGEIEAGRHVDTSAMHPALLQLFAPQVQDYLISVFATDPVEAVRRAKVPTLIVQGSNDLQVTEADARLLDRAPKTKLEIIRGMNHVLKLAPADRAGNLATYVDPSLPLAPGLIREIEDFIEDDD